MKLHNGGLTPASGNLKLYYANASSSLVWPAGFTQIGDVAIVGFAANSTKVVEVSWPDPPGSGHYCMIARWESASDPMAVAESADVDANTRNNNNVVWRNMDIAALGGDSFRTSFEARSTRGRGFWLRWRALGERPFLPAGIVRFSISVDGKPVRGRPGPGIVPAGDGYLVRVSGAQIFFSLPKDVTGKDVTSTVDVQFRRTPGIENRHYRFEIDQLEPSPSTGALDVVGGMAYDIDATKTAFKQ